jgi:hypothetical protein
VKHAHVGNNLIVRAAVAIFCLGVAGCDSKAAGTSVAATPQFTEHLICVAMADEQRWQHMYRLDLEQGIGEFVGGFDGTITTQRSATMRMMADRLQLLFDPSAQDDGSSNGIELDDFAVTIYRQDLLYEVERAWAEGTAQNEASGQCSVLDGKEFSTQPPKSSQ